MTDVGQGTILALSRDVFFAMRIRTMLAHLGWSLQICSDELELMDAVRAHPRAGLALVDFNKPVDWDALAGLIASSLPTIGYSSHTNVEGFRAAKNAGITRVVSNGELSRSLPDLIERYARP